MDIFAREQQIFENAEAAFRAAEKGEQIDAAIFSKLTEDYGKLLKQFKQFRYMKGSSERTVKPSEPTKKETLNKIHFDVLTGVYNKHYLNESMDRVLGTMGRHGDMLSVLQVDIDFFGQYNTTYGHNAGDDCLRYIAEVLKSCLFRGQDFVARFGGEEFMAILPYTPEGGARLVADRMLEEVRRLRIPHTSSPLTDHVTISIGLVTGEGNPGGWTASDFFRRADEAIFQAKQRGRNQYVFLELSYKEKI